MQTDFSKLCYSLHWVAQKNIQEGFYYLQRRRSKILCAQPALVLCQPHNKDVFLVFRQNFLYSLLWQTGTTLTSFGKEKMFLKASKHRSDDNSPNTAEVGFRGPLLIFSTVWYNSFDASSAP